MDNDKESVHLLIILKSVTIRDRDVNWQSAATEIDAPLIYIGSKTENWCPWKAASG